MGSAGRPVSGRDGPSKPPSRALDAMAHAAERARQASASRPTGGGRRPGRRMLPYAVTLVAVLGLVLGLVLTMTGGPSRGSKLSTRAEAVPAATRSTATSAPPTSSPTTSSAPSTAAPTSPSTAPPPTSAPSTSPSSGTSSPPSTSPPSSTSTTAPSGTGAAGPQLSGVVPDSGSAGDLVALTGSGLYDPGGGSVVASFGGTAAPTYCGAQDSCLVQVPDLGPAATSVPVTVTAGAGTSNAISFSYG